MAKTQNIHFRAEPDLLQRIDEEAAALGVPRASLVRMLVSQGMGDDNQKAVLRESYYRLQPVIRTVIGQAIQRLNEDLPELLDNAMTANAAAE